ncbi:MAG: hypothetical protein ABI744_06900 [Chloroflexota bacterium]
MSITREEKPAWAALPRFVRADAERLLGAQVLRGVRKYGGYGPSATYDLTLADGRHAFFKGVYPLPAGSGVIWNLDEEERVYAELGDLLAPWAPTYFGSFRRDGWHALLLEALDGVKVPPWTRALAERALRSYAEFHASTIDQPLPEWLPRDQHLESTGYWKPLTTDRAQTERLVATCAAPGMGKRANDWLAAHGAALIAAEQPLAAIRRFALLHFDTHPRTTFASTSGPCAFSIGPSPAPGRPSSILRPSPNRLPARAGRVRRR